MFNWAASTAAFLFAVKAWKAIKVNNFKMVEATGILTLTCSLIWNPEPFMELNCG
jgi:hypothetical protein